VRQTNGLGSRYKPSALSPTVVSVRLPNQAFSLPMLSL
jgi:hypothetical protein